MSEGTRIDDAAAALECISSNHHVMYCGTDNTKASLDSADKVTTEDKLPVDAGKASSSAMEDPEVIKSFQQRLHEIESKVGLVDIIYGLHESTKEARAHGNHDALLERVSPIGVSRWDRYTGEVKFLRDSVYFMQRIRDSYEVILNMEKQRSRDLRMHMKRKRNAVESISAQKISTKAFLEGERARTIQLDWDEFVSDVDWDTSIMCPIEVIAKDPESRTILLLGAERKERKLRSGGQTLPTENNEEPYEQRPLPERIKTYSAPLMVILSQMTSDAVWTQSLGSSIVLLRPFQDLFYYEALLRQWLARLEKDFAGSDGSIDIPETPTRTGENDHKMEGAKSASFEGSTGSLPSPASTSAEQQKVVDSKHPGRSNVDDGNAYRENNDRGFEGEEADFQNNGNDSDSDSEDSRSHEKQLANSMTALIHLRSLVEFVDNRLKPRQDHVESSICSHVSFHDLWHLFKPGTEVIEQGGKQAFVVLRVEVPVHKIEEPWDRWSKKLAGDSEEQATKDRSHFTLHCVSIDFDGKDFGPVSKAFIVSPFGDLKPVMSLPIFPVRFKGPSTRENLIQRGRLLLEVADFKAMYYTGATLDKGDEIDSQVVIDISEALADDDRSAAWKPTISPVNTAPEDRRDAYCDAFCCRYHPIMDGFSTDLKMTTDYIGSLVPDARAQSLILSPRSLENTLGSIDELTETELLIMTYRVFGFVLRSRKWGKISFHNLILAASSEYPDVFQHLSPA